MIAATVAGIPDILGDKSCMAIRVAELARAGLTPDWTPGAAPHSVPIIVKQNQHGTRAGIPVLSASAFTQLVTAFMAPPGPLQACPASGAAGSLYQRPPLRRTCAATRARNDQMGIIFI